ncbi:MAG: hypothetical protein QGG36_15465 [Pirellulaceae bacterium]|nr:hypothetical protein [Pirellulaceae bacterium]
MISTTRNLLIFGCIVVAAGGPVAAVSYFLAWDRRTAIQNLVTATACTILGGFVGTIVFLNSSGRVPPDIAFQMVGVWLGGCIGAGLSTGVRLARDPREFKLRRSIRSLLAAVAIVCVLLAIIGFVWNRNW